MKKPLLTVALAVSGATVAFAAQKIFSTNGSALFEVSSSDRGQTIKRIETRFIENVTSEGRWLFKAVQRSVYNTALEGSDDETHIEAYSSRKSMYDTKSWTAKFKGSGLQAFNEEFVSVTEGGCCGSPDIVRLINMKTGIITEATLNTSALEIEVPNSSLKRRYLAEANDSKAPQLKGDKKYIGTVSYFDGEKIRGRARIYARLPDGWGTSFSELKPVLTGRNDVQGRRVTLWNSDRATSPQVAFNDFGISGEISYADRTESFKIMISNDKIDALKSTVSSDLDIDFVSLL